MDTHINTLLNDVADELNKLSISSTQCSKTNTTMNRVTALRDCLLKTHINHKNAIKNEPSLKDAHAYCVIHNLSAQKFGPLLECYIIEKYGFCKNNAANCIGDCSKNNENYEIKISLGGATHNRFNFVQLRPSHDISFYLLIAYHLSESNVNDQGDLFVFKVPKKDLLDIIVEFGAYAHGTIHEHKKINRESLMDIESKKEYAIRTTYNDKCWKSLLPYRIEEEHL